MSEKELIIKDKEEFLQNKGKEINLALEKVIKDLQQLHEFISKNNSDNYDCSFDGEFCTYLYNMQRLPPFIEKFIEGLNYSQSLYKKRVIIGNIQKLD